MKIGNIMLAFHSNAKLFDFGLAKFNDILNGEDSFSMSSKAIYVGSGHFMSPKMLNNEYYEYKTDIYSFGVIIYDIFVGSLSNQKLSDRIRNKQIELPKESSSISNVCIQIDVKMIIIEP